MATENRGVMVYLPSELEAKIAEYCTEHKITRKDKQGNTVTSLGSGIVAYLKSHLLGDIPISTSDRPLDGLTREEVLDLIAESSTSNTPIVGVASLAENRIPAPMEKEIVQRLDTMERSLSSFSGVLRDEVEQLIQASEQKIMAAVRSLLLEQRVEIAEVTTIDERVNTPDLAISTTSQERAIEKTVKPLATDTATTFMPDRRLISKDIRVWFDRLERDERFREIVQSEISKDLSNRTIANRLFKLGYGRDKNTKPYFPSLIDLIKTAWGWLPDTYKKQTAEDTFKSPALDPINSATSDRQPISKDIRRWLEPLKDKQFRGIIQAGISDKWSNQEIVNKLFDAGYGKNGNIEPYTANLASAMKTAYLLDGLNQQSTIE